MKKFYENSLEKMKTEKDELIGRANRMISDMTFLSAESIETMSVRLESLAKEIRTIELEIEKYSEILQVITYMEKEEI